MQHAPWVYVAHRKLDETCTLSLRRSKKKWNGALSKHLLKGDGEDTEVIDWK